MVDIKLSSLELELIFTVYLTDNTIVITVPK